MITDLIGDRCTEYSVSKKVKRTDLNFIPKFYEYFSVAKEIWKIKEHADKTIPQ